MNEFFSGSGVAYPISAFEILLNIGLAFVLGLFVVTVYRLTNRNQAMSASFVLTLMILGMVVAMVMMIIGNSVARAFSLVGALSIIRFRTVVKDNRDIAFVFYSLASGMACGVGNYPLAVYGSGLIGLLLLFLDFTGFGSVRRGTFILRCQIVPQDTPFSAMEAILSQYLVSYRQVSVKTLRLGEYVQYTYMVRMRSESQLQVFISALSAIEGMERVNMLSDEEEPEA